MLVGCIDCVAVLESRTVDGPSRESTDREDREILTQTKSLQPFAKVDVVDGGKRLVVRVELVGRSACVVAVARDPVVSPRSESTERDERDRVRHTRSVHPGRLEEVTLGLLLGIVVGRDGKFMELRDAETHIRSVHPKFNEPVAADDTEDAVVVGFACVIVELPPPKRLLSKLREASDTETQIRSVQP